MSMKDISTTELQTAFEILYLSDCDEVWREINFELSERLSKYEYMEFINQQRERQINVLENL